MLQVRDASGNMVDLLTLLGSLGSVTDVISNSSELVVTTSGTTKILTLNLGGYVTSTALTNALAAYTDTTALTTFLGAKQNTLTAGTGIAISGATISSTHTPIILQLDGTTQSGATTLNFVGNNASFASNVLNISRMAWQDALTLRYSNSASDKNLSQGSAGELLWNGLEVQLRQNAFHQINVAAPLTVSGANSITLDTLWKPSTVTVGTGIQAVASDANGTLQLNRSRIQVTTETHRQPECCTIHCAQHYWRSYVQLIYPGRPDVFEFKLFYYGLCEYISCRKTANANYWRRNLPQWSHHKQLYS